MSGDEIEELTRQRDEIDARIAEIRRAEACPACDGPAVIRTMSGGFVPCFYCRADQRRVVALRSGRELAWSDLGVGLLRLDRSPGWGGRLERAWLREDPLYPILTELLQSVGSP